MIRLGDIRPCPCCGGTAFMRWQRDLDTGYRYSFIECDICKLHSAAYYDAAHALAAWNYRVSDVPIPACPHPSGQSGHAL